VENGSGEDVDAWIAAHSSERPAARAVANMEELLGAGVVDADAHTARSTPSGSLSAWPDKCPAGGLARGARRWSRPSRRRSDREPADALIPAEMARRP
jgi:hypothetical protein